jgi:hypothetical protein
MGDFEAAPCERHYRPKFEKIAERKLEGLRFHSLARGESFEDFVLFVFKVLHVLRLREELEGKRGKRKRAGNGMSKPL